LPARAQTATLIRDADGGVVRRTTLPGGLRVVTEYVPGVRSVALGVWVAAGSRDEPPSQMGSAHFLEHLLFKGTTHRDAMAISAQIESVGGDLNAFTTKEYTCYHARVLDEHLPLALDVVCDVVLNATLHDHDIESERAVICEEIAMYEDDPGDLVHDEFARAMFGDTPLGRPILGTVDTITALPRSAIKRFYRSAYTPDAMVVSVAGNVDHAAVVRDVKRIFTGRLDPTMEPRPARSGAKGSERGRRSVSEPVRISSRPTEQAHLMLGAPGIRRGDDRRFAVSVLSTALGGGMSSRLFQEVREKRGLAYSVYSYAQSFADTGVFGLYAGCLPSKADTVLDVCLSELEAVARTGLTSEELQRAKGQVKGSMVLGQEDPASRMTRIARAELHDEPLQTIDQLLHRVDAVSAEDVHAIAQDLLTQSFTLAAIGPFDQTHTFNAVG
jgi:predicted Zn-dependent peptidase